MNPSVFVIGATGYIGSYLARSLVSSGSSVTGLVRTRSAADTMRADGIMPSIGDARDMTMVAAQAKSHDVTIFAPQLLVEEEFQSVFAILDAIAESGKTFIFTSGTGVLAQRTNGDWSEDTFAEDDPFIPLRWIKRRVETESMVRAAAQRDIRGIVIRPPEIWGHGGGRRIKLVAEAAQRTGAACYVGRGLNLYSNVHIDDLVDLYRRVIDHGVAGALYHAVAGEVNQRTVTEAIARIIGCPAKSISLSDAVELWGKNAALITLSVCSRSRSPRSRHELGWTPRHVDLIEDVLTGSYHRRYGNTANRHDHPSS